MKKQEIDQKFVNELTGILELLNAKDFESNHLGYDLLRQSEFKKFVRGKLLTKNNRSYYRFWLYKLQTKPARTPEIQCARNYHNQNKLGYAHSIVQQYLNGDFKIVKPKWQPLTKHNKD